VRGEIGEKVWSSRDSTTTPVAPLEGQGEENIRTRQRSKVEKASKEPGSVRGDIHRDQDAIIVIRVEPTTLTPDHSSKAPR
jgi:hypothetical protein